jgi:hypothetical protein
MPPPPLPQSIRLEIISALAAALGVSSSGGYAAPAGLTIQRERTRPIETDSLPSIFVYFEDDPVKPFDAQTYRSPFVIRELAVGAECRAQASQSLPPDAALDPILVWAVKAGLADETFGGLAIGALESRTEWKSREGDVPVAAATLHFSIRYRTSRLDPTANATNT